MMSLDSSAEWRSWVVEAQARGAVLDASVLGKANWKVLGSLGHVMGRFWAAQQVLVKRGAGQVEGLQRWLDVAPQIGLVTEEFAIAVRVTSGGVRWLGVVDEEMEWANAAIWAAFLRLPALQGFWKQQLRGNVLEGLLRVVPEAWLMEATPLPPGAVIGGLGICDWKDLEKVEGNFVKGEDGVLSRVVEEEGAVVVARYGVNAKGTNLIEVVGLMGGDAG